MRIYYRRLLLCSLALWAGITCHLFSQYYLDPSQHDKSKSFRWPEGKRLAISLTFDDARLSQIDKGIPVLDKYNVKGTFYISPDNMLQRINGWKAAQDNGHEIGNHSVYHPCTGNFEWSREHALEDYTLTSMFEELDSANRLIMDQLGVIPFSFAYPCGQSFVGRDIETKSYVPLIASMFESGRSWLSESSNDPAYCDLSQLAGMELDGKSFDDIKKIIDSSKGKWIVLAGHEMDEGGFQTSLLSTIEELCRYTSDPANAIWIDTVHNIAAYINLQRYEPAIDEYQP